MDQPCGPHPSLLPAHTEHQLRYSTWTCSSWSFTSLTDDNLGSTNHLTDMKSYSSLCFPISPPNFVTFSNGSSDAASVSSPPTRSSSLPHLPQPPQQWSDRPFSIHDVAPLKKEPLPRLPSIRNCHLSFVSTPCRLDPAFMMQSNSRAVFQKGQLIDTGGISLGQDTETIRSKFDVVKRCWSCKTTWSGRWQRCLKKSSPRNNYPTPINEMKKPDFFTFKLSSYKPQK